VALYKKLKIFKKLYKNNKIIHLKKKKKKKKEEEEEEGYG
jgi:hypothetical protein